ELFQQHVEDIFPGWPDDQETTYHSVVNILDAVSPNQRPFIVQQSKDLKEVKQFAVDLLKKTILHEQETEALVVPYLAHWEKERLAMLDLVLMKMAITEWLYFPEIPV